jgi:hypothetical protein
MAVESELIKKLSAAIITMSFPKFLGTWEIPALSELSLLYALFQRAQSLTELKEGFRLYAIKIGRSIMLAADGDAPLIETILNLKQVVTCMLHVTFCSFAEHVCVRRPWKRWWPRSFCYEKII